VLYIKKERVLDKRAPKVDGTADNGPVFKEIRPVKLDFSATNFKAKVTGWLLSIENKADTLFPTVCDTARGIVGIIAAATADVTQLEHQDPQILARANLASEDEDSADTQAIDQDHGDKSDEHHDNGVDDGNNSGIDEDHNNGVDEDHNNGGDDSYGHDNGGDGSDGHEGDNRIGSEEDEDSSSNDGDNYDNDHNGSDLTEISSSSDVSKIVEDVPAPGSRRKRVQRGRH
jgi:hypothetical protein